MGIFPTFGADESREISRRGSLLRSLEDLGVGVGAADAGDLGRVMLLLATILAISAVPEEVNAKDLEKPVDWSWEGGMKWVTRGIRYVAEGLGGIGLAAPVSGAGAGEVEGVGIYVKDRLGDRQPISVITVADIKNIEEETISFQQTSWFDSILNFFKSLFG